MRSGRARAPILDARARWAGAPAIHSAARTPTYSSVCRNRRSRSRTLDTPTPQPRVSARCARSGPARRAIACPSISRRVRMLPAPVRRRPPPPVRSRRRRPLLRGRRTRARVSASNPDTSTLAAGAADTSPPAATATSVDDTGHDVVHAFHEERAVAQQSIWPCAAEIAGKARNRAHLAPLLERPLRGDQRAAPGTAFDHDDRVAQTTDDAVASRKDVRERLRAAELFGDDAPARARRCIRAPFSGGYTTSTPVPTTATVSPSAASAPSCAAVSMPRAMPLTIVMPSSRQRARELARERRSRDAGLARADDRHGGHIGARAARRRGRTERRGAAPARDRAPPGIHPPSARRGARPRAPSRAAAIDHHARHTRRARSPIAARRPPIRRVPPGAGSRSSDSHPRVASPPTLDSLPCDADSAPPLTRFAQPSRSPRAPDPSSALLVPPPRSERWDRADAGAPDRRHPHPRQ